MSKILLVLLATFCFTSKSFSQVKIGNNATTINGGSVLELESTNQGLYLPRINLTATGTWGLAGIAPSTAATGGMVVYNINAAITGTGASGIGIYYWTGSQWSYLTNGFTAGSAWSLTGNTISAGNFLGTTNAQALVLKANNTQMGYFDGSLSSLALGVGAVNSSSDHNTAIGYSANTNNQYALALGSYASATGVHAVAIGNVSPSTTATTASGAESIAIGYSAISSNSQSTAIGFQATASGLYGIAVGYGAQATTAQTTAVGMQSLANQQYANAVGYTAQATGLQATALGYAAIASGTNATAIGANASASQNNSLILGEINGVNGASANTNVGIGTTTPSQPLEVGNTTGTVRIDGLKSGNTYNSASTAATSTLVYSNNTTGDLYALPTVNNAILITSATGVPSWSNAFLASTDWQLLGNTGITQPAVPGTYGTSNFAATENWVGTTDAKDFTLGTNKTERMRVLSTGNIGIGTAAPNANLDVKGFATTTGTVLNVNANALTSGTALAVSGTNATGNTTSITANSLTTGTGLAVTSTGTIIAGGSLATFSASSLTSGTGLNLSANAMTSGNAMNISANGLTTGNGLNIASSSIAGTGGGSSYLINLSRSGANANATHTAFGISSAVTNTGAANTNIAGYFSASGGTNNYGVIVPSTGGNSGFGTNAPVATVDVSGNYKLGSIGTITKNSINFSTVLSATSVPTGFSLINILGINVILFGSTANYIDVTITLPATLSGTQGTVCVSPAFDLPTGITIASARLLSTTQAKIRFMNTQTSSQSISGTMYVTVTEF